MDDRRGDKVNRVRDPHVAPLNALRERWLARSPEREIPQFDPDDGGVAARVLVLMESPAPSTVGPNGTGFCSEDNPDRSNQLLARIRAESGVPRSACLKWNVVPWAVLDEGRHPTAPSAVDLRDATPYLTELLEIATGIDVVITLGRPALAGFMSYTTATSPQLLYRVISAPHPSQRNSNARADSIARITNAFTSLAAYLESSRDPLDHR